MNPNNFRSRVAPRAKTPAHPESPVPHHNHAEIPAKTAAAVTQADAAPQFLVSIRNVAEAKLARDHGVDWIDLKDPDAGSLGAPSYSTVQAVATNLSDFPRRSVAAGELRQLAALRKTAGPNHSLLQFFCHSFPIIKVGLSGVNADADSNWKVELRRLSLEIAENAAQLVPVIYADYATCGAPTPADVAELAGQLASPYLLIDTYHKDGRGVLDCIELDAIQRLATSAAATGCGVVLAGSLKPEDLPRIADLPIAAIAVRGAVCRSDRRSELCNVKLARWVRLVRQLRLQNVS